MENKDINMYMGSICMIIFMVIILGTALFPTYCAHAGTVNLKCGEIKQDRKSKTYYQALASSQPCPTAKPCLECQPPVVCSSLKPCPACPECPPCPTPAPTPVPTVAPTPIPTPMPTAVPGRTFRFMGAQYVGRPFDSATSEQISRALKLKSYAEVVLTWWYALPQQSWCNYLRKASAVKYCGVYDDWGYMFTNDELYTKYVVPYHPEWRLYTPSGSLVMNRWNPTGETPLDFGNSAFVDFYIGYFKRPPAGVNKMVPSQASVNARFLDNFVIYAINNNAWNATPINPRTKALMTNEERAADVLAAMKRISADNKANGVISIANVWSDVTSDYFKRPAYYRELLQYVDYALFEVTTSSMEHVPYSESVWLNYVKVAQDIAKNTPVTPVMTTEYGDFWYNVATALLACEPGKCMTWQQPVMTDAQIQKLTTLDLGTPGTDYTKAGCYLRPWAKGLVIVNPMDSGSCSVPLSGSYRDLETGSTVTGTVEVKMKDGKVLVRE